jgi:glyoxylase-like metal-dependent hydrolase (beta-lactamase superfamily II)
MNMPGASLVCHVLLVETNGGLVLVDSGFGTRDCAHPGRLGPARFVSRPVLRREETALAQVEALGFGRDDVRHVVVTHFDLDHVGGIADFPDALIHVTAAEARGATRSPTRREAVRYRKKQWAHGPVIVEHDPDGERWRGFAAAKELDEIAPGIVLVSLPGHTRGHACVAVDAGHRWVLHAGDSFYHYGTLDGRTRVPKVLTTQEKAVAFDRKKVRDNHARLAALARRAEPDLLIVNAHNPTLFTRARQSS